MRTVDIHQDPDAARIAYLIDLMRREAAALEAALPGALDAQWLPSRAPRARDDTAERARGLPTDPTAEAALDTERLRLRAQIVRSERILQHATVALRGVRRGLEMAVAAWDGLGRPNASAETEAES